MNFTFTEAVLLIGGGPVDRAQVERVLSFAKVVVAADSGADVAVEFGLAVDGLIGDMDSVSPQVKVQNRLRDPDQNTTDFEKCLKYISAPLIIGVGFLGGRLDHELAVMNALAKSPAQKVVLLGARDVVFRCPVRLELALPADTRLSLFPMGAVSELASTGLQYALDGVEMASDGVIGTSNRTDVDRQVISVENGALLAILPETHLKEAIRGLYG